MSSSLRGLGKALAVLRSRRGLTQRELEAAAGIAENSVSRFEGGKHMRLEILGRILEVLDADLYDLGVEARRAAGGETPTTNGETGPREGRLSDLVRTISRLERELQSRDAAAP